MELIHWRSMGEHMGWRVNGEILTVKRGETISMLRKW